MANRESHGIFCWQELMTSNVEKAANFYKDLFGWDLNEMKMGGMNYTLIKNQGSDIGGMMTLPPEMKNAPPHWNAYFTVTNLDDTMEVIRGNNGNIIMGPQDIPETGRFAFCQAPDSTVFYLFQYIGK